MADAQVLGGAAVPVHPSANHRSAMLPREAHGGRALSNRAYTSSGRLDALAQQGLIQPAHKQR